MVEWLVFKTQIGSIKIPKVAFHTSKNQTLISCRKSCTIVLTQGQSDMSESDNITRNLLGKLFPVPRFRVIQ